MNKLSEIAPALLFVLGLGYYLGGTIGLVITIPICIYFYCTDETNNPQIQPQKRTSMEDILAIYKPVIDKKKPKVIDLGPVKEWAVTERKNLMYISKTDKEKYMKGLQWRNLKTQRMSLANHKCEVEGCGSATDLNLHHIHYENLTAEKLEDLRIVCQECHHKLHEKLGYDRGGFYPI